ncbi:putative proliferating cell nuclear antigen [Golovinomyces cichoracearum]|uniref:Vezatin n=1 Tax=Golovinomyces cichoracearum TaxID=62708 RepID=A0A420IZN7_9PEZI|nr:putative proliferating cell nuclear antigen [Golovinomyces cichoracearum]
MEVVVLEDSPLAEYFEAEGQNYNVDSVASISSRPPGQSFAPKGRPFISILRSQIISPRWLETPRNRVFSLLLTIYSRAIDTRLSQVDNSRILERFRYLIVASQLLNLSTYPNHTGNLRSGDAPAGDVLASQAFTPTGVASIAFSAFSLAWLIHWTRCGVGFLDVTSRIIILLIFIVVVGLKSYIHFRRRWILHISHETLVELSNLITATYNLDNVAVSTLSLIQEVELLSRGYQIGSPMPPASRIEDRIQTRKCLRLRKEFRNGFSELNKRYISSCKTLEPLAEKLDLEKYYDIYDINELDLADAFSQIPESDSEELESIRALKLLAVRYNIARKMFFCCLMALNTNGSKNESFLWNIKMEEIQQISSTTAKIAESLAKSLNINEEENFSISPTSKVTQVPGRERWRAQTRQLSSLSTGIRGLQAKLHVLREESDRHLNENEDASDFCSNLVIQYESLGADLKALLQDWEEGKSVVFSNVDRNERRASCFSGMISPTASLGGLTAVEENGSAFEALKALNGEARSRSSMDFSSSDFEEVFEAIAVPPHRGSLSREERIAKIKDDRAKRYSTRNFQDNNTKILRELESVIKLKPRNRLSVGARFSSM